MTEKKSALFQIAHSFVALDLEIQQRFPPSRERSLAITKLEEAAMWLGKAAEPKPEQRFHGQDNLDGGPS